MTVSKKPSWWKKHFDRLSLRGYGLERRTSVEVRALIRMLGLKPGAAVLDLACGSGRHSAGLAAAGLRVTGLDYSKELLAAAPAGAGVEFVHGDMRRLRFKPRFDAVVNLFTSFGYFDTEAEDLAVLRGVRRALRPGGLFLIDVLNKEWLMRHFTPSFWQREPDADVLKMRNRLRYDFVRGRLCNHRMVYLRDGRRTNTTLDFRVYSLNEMVRLMDIAGLRFLRAYGGFDGRPYGMDAKRLIALARK